ncbi:DEAD/DEAH box helicase [Demequina litorisediminis]|uniref:DEAD/DEAH box helicase n=1 Tax=Demequina litorisediminis TaxID=1849022 RepID=UPI0032AFDE46
MSEDSAPASADETEAVRFLGLAVGALGGSPREGQERMVAAVERALTNGEHALIQAGTGTGKSLGYLVPAIVHAARAGERIVVSTATLALQRQVFSKDLPMVLDALEGEPRLASGGGAVQGPLQLPVRPQDGGRLRRTRRGHAAHLDRPHERARRRGGPPP